MIWAQSRALTYENYSTVDSMEGGCVCALLFRFLFLHSLIAAKGAMWCVSCVCAPFVNITPILQLPKTIRYIIMHLECITMDKIIVITEQFI